MGQASSAYVECAGLEYADFMSLVHADMEVLGEAAACFKGKVEEMKVCVCVCVYVCTRRRRRVTTKKPGGR